MNQFVMDFQELAPADFPITLALWAPGVDRHGPPSFRLIASGPSRIEFTDGIEAGCRVRMAFAGGQAYDEEIP